MKNQISNGKSDFTASPQIAYSQNENSKLSQLFSILSLNFFKSKPVVAVLRLEGIIGKAGMMKSGLSLDSLDELIKKTFNMEKLQAVCLIINSPGGSPVQSELISKRIYNLGREKNVPIYSFVEDVAASGGYWLACSAQEIYASRSSIIGSIGVTSTGFGFTDAIKKMGIERRVYTQGNNKSVLDPFKPVQEKDLQIIANIQKEIHQHFIDTVKSRRGNRLTQNDDLLFNGEFWCGQIAADYGLIDGIDDLYSFVNERFGNDVKIKNVKNQQSWFKKKFGIELSWQNFTDNLARSWFNVLENKTNNDKFDFN